MAKYRILLIITFAWLTLLFNVERIDILESQPFNLDTSVYILTLLTTLSVVAFPNLGRMNPWATGAGLVLLYVALGLIMNPNWFDRPPLIITLEIVAIGVTLFLMRRVSGALLEYEMNVETFVLDVNGARMLPTAEGVNQINSELYRARRFERPVSLVHIRIPQVATDVQATTIESDFVKWRITQAFKNRYLQVNLAKLVASLTYKGDIAVEYKEGIVVCLPETSAMEAAIFTNQLTTMVEAMFHAQAEMGVAVFPEDGLIFEELINVAEEKTHLPETPDSHRDGGDTGSGDVQETAIRVGDLWVSDEDRMRIAQNAAWLNRFAYQSHSSRMIYLFIKRVLDAAIVLSVTIVLLPILLLLVIVIFLDDPGSPFYVQERTGYGGKRFKMYKFRTMYQNAAAMPAQRMVMADGTVRYLWPEKTDKDPRITRVGRILRKTSLDELPQLYNVIVGDMSLVGPRPTSWQLDKYTLHQTERLTVRPGITGLWQVCARESKNFDERLLWDMRYIEKLSLSLDLQILWRTVAQVFSKGGV